MAFPPSWIMTQRDPHRPHLDNRAYHGNGDDATWAWFLGYSDQEQRGAEEEGGDANDGDQEQAGWSLINLKTGWAAREEAVLIWNAEGDRLESIAGAGEVDVEGVRALVDHFAGVNGPGDSKDIAE